MTWNCDVCGEKIHIQRINGKNYPAPCPLEPYKLVKSFYPDEFKQMLSFLYSESISVSNDPASLKSFSEIVPKKTDLSDYVLLNKKDSLAVAKPLIVQAKLETFFAHFNRVLIDIYGDNKIHYIDSPVRAAQGQFNYLWLTPSTLRECYFREGRNASRFKSMSELQYPSLVIYPIGSVMSVKHGSWGDILLDLITNRQAEGKPTWIVNSKGWGDCPEIISSEKLRAFLTRSSNIPTLELDEDIELYSKPLPPAKGATGGTKGKKNNLVSYI